MAHLLNIKAKYEPLKTLGFAAIGANFAGIVTMAGAATSVEHPARIYHIVNNTDKDLLFSWDGIDPFVLIRAGSSFTDDLCANQALTSSLVLSEGSRLYVKHNGAAPTSGSIYLTICYAGDH